MSRPGKRQEARTEILAAAARVIADHGYHGMSMRELARATGRGLATFYNYFASKEEVLFALQKGAFETLLKSSEAAIAHTTAPSERLHVFILNHVRYVAEHPEVMRVLVHEAGALPSRRRGVVRRLKNRYFDVGQSIVAEILQHGCGAVALTPARSASGLEIERITYALFGMMNWMWSWYRPSRHGSPEDVARELGRVALCGMLTQCPLAPVQAAAEERLASLERPPLIQTSAQGSP